MKKIFTLLLSSLFSLSLLAYDGSRLSISTASNSKMDFRVEVNGKKFSMQDNSITISNLSEGTHNVRIFRMKKKTGNGFGFRQKQEIIYATSVFLRKGFHLDITINRFGKALVDERRINPSDEDWFLGEEEYYEDFEGDYDNSYRNVMTAGEFASVKQALTKEWMESNKLKSAKFIIDQNNFTSIQVREMMLLFSFESNKLEIAKYAYHKVVDKKNYFQLNDVFSFSSSKDELARFIRESH
jgi:hypothetical protein